MPPIASAPSGEVEPEELLPARSHRAESVSYPAATCQTRTSRSNAEAAAFALAGRSSLTPLERRPSPCVPQAGLSCRTPLLAIPERTRSWAVRVKLPRNRVVQEGAMSRAVRLHVLIRRGSAPDPGSPTRLPRWGPRPGSVARGDPFAPLRSLARPCVMCVALLAVVARGEAQVISGTVEGRVTDSSGAVLPGVTITALNTATAATFT